MTFTSFAFLLIFPAVVLLYNLLRNDIKVAYLLVISYLFYAMMQPVYLLLLIGVTVATYFFARKISSSANDNRKHLLLVLGIIVVLIPLLFFKYFNPINQYISALLPYIGIHANYQQYKLLLPVGVSFYTFMAIGYLTDVYNDDMEAEKKFCSVGLFLSFFPIVLSGPIERAKNMLPQWNKLSNSTKADLVNGVKLMLWGYFMKVCVANRLGVYVDTVFGNIANSSGTTLVIASILYPFQIYADLGGYSLVAIGAAQCFGIKVIPNFRRPFLARSMSDFWRRWHMSLIQWLTDYIYTPLSFTFRSWKGWGIVSAILITFIISGLWHGAALTFIFWGLIQGLYVSFDAITQNKRTTLEKKFNLSNNVLYSVISCLVVFVLFAFSEIFAKCSNLSQANHFIEKAFSDGGIPFIDSLSLKYGFIALLILFFVDLRDEFFPLKCKLFNSNYLIIRLVSYIAIIFMIMKLGLWNAGQFIYFHF
jgi:alginate O-acetyltransferase complex protein AlgI